MLKLSYRLGISEQYAEKKFVRISYQDSWKKLLIFAWSYQNNILHQEFVNTIKWATLIHCNNNKE